MEDLTEQDYNVLLEAVDVWIDKDFGKSLIHSMLDAMVTDKAPPHVKAKIESASKTKDAEAKAAKTLRGEQAILLKAKLLKLRDSAAIEQLG